MFKKIMTTMNTWTSKWLHSFTMDKSRTMKMNKWNKFRRPVALFIQLEIKKILKILSNKR